MPESLGESIVVEVADNLRVDIQTKHARIVCEWDLGYMDGDTFVWTSTVGYVFEGAEYDTLCSRQDFRATKTNYANIRDVMYAALHVVGQI